MRTQFGSGQQTGDSAVEVARAATNEALDGIEGDRVDFCQVFSSTKFDYQTVLDEIREIIGDDPELIGCSSAGEFTEHGVNPGTATVALVASDTLKFFTSMESGLSDDPRECIFDAVRQLPRNDDIEVEGYPHLAAINLHDGLSGIGKQIADITKDYLDEDVKLAGGSAGDDLQMEETHIFCGDEVATDAVGLALIASREPIPMTVNHGHEPISDPLTVTESDGSTVYELNGEPAYNVWREAINDSAQEIYDIDVDDLEDGSDDLSMMLTRYEFGIDTQPEKGASGLLGKLKQIVSDGFVSTSGYNIRWPGLTTSTDGPLEFAVEVPEETQFRVMHSSPKDQIKSVRTAARNATRGSGENGIAGAFVYDCVCRGTILGSDFDEAVKAISEELQVPFTGFETYGEICTESDEYSSYHNTTSVVMLLPR